MVPPKLVVLNWRDWKNPRAGGAEFLIESISKQLVREGVDVVCLTTRFPGSPSEELDGGVRIVRRGNWLTTYLHAARELQVLLRERQDLMVLESVNTVPYFTRLPRGSRRVILIHHIAGRELFVEVPFPGSLGLYLLERAYSRLSGADPVVTISEHSKTELQRAGYPPDRVRVIPPGLDEDQVPPVRSAPNGHSHRVCFLGPLKVYKGVLDVLEALPALQHRYPDAALDIVGRGYLEGELRSRAHALGLDDRVTFHGFVDSTTKFSILNGAGAFVYPSVSEGGCSLAVLEAMSVGLPIVVTPTLEEMAEDGRGRVVPLHRPDLIADAISELWADPERLQRIARNNERWARQFTTRRAADRFLSLLTVPDGPPAG